MRYLVLAVLLTGCAGKVRPDYGMPAISAGYPTAEIVACDQRWNGLASCVTPADSDFSFSVQGYNKGTIQVDSSNCEIHSKVRYKDSEEVRFSVTAKKNCLIDILVSPEFPGEADSGLRISSIKGRLHLATTKDSESYFVSSSKVKAGTGATLRTPAYNQLVRVAFSGCGASYNKRLYTKDGEVQTKLSSLVSTEYERTCLFEGVVLGQTRTAWQVWIYDEAFSQVADPSVEIASRRLKVSADPSVAAVILDDEYVLGNEAKFDFDPIRDHVLRTITVGGRNIIGVWAPEVGMWSWIR